MVKINILVNKHTIRIMKIILTIFAAYLIYQIIRKMIGGSWSIEEIILGILILNVGATFTVGLLMAELKSDIKHLKGQFRSLATDFKAHLKK